MMLIFECWKKEADSEKNIMFSLILDQYAIALLDYLIHAKQLISMQHVQLYISGKLYCLVFSLFLSDVNTSIEQTCKK